jgi:hypothetical protein
VRDSTSRDLTRKVKGHKTDSKERNRPNETD